MICSKKMWLCLRQSHKAFVIVRLYLCSQAKQEAAEHEPQSSRFVAAGGSPLVQNVMAGQKLLHGKIL
jgi:hypothetical protein